MSSVELRKAADVLAGEWEPEDGCSTEELASAISMIDFLRECADFFETLPPTVAARALTVARLVNGGAA